METVFISSLARGDMAAVRTAARAGVESLQMRPVMFETAAASREDSAVPCSTSSVAATSSCSCSVPSTVSAPSGVSARRRTSSTRL